MNYLSSSKNAAKFTFMTSLWGEAHRREGIATALIELHFDIAVPALGSAL
jgi:hypothetical protein